METVFEKPLNGEIGNLTNLTTTAKTDLVSAVNEVKGDIPAVINNLTSDSTTSALSAAQGKALNSNKANVKALNLTNTISASSTADLKTALLTFVTNNVNSDGVATVVLKLTSGVTAPLYSGGWGATIQKASNNYFSLICSNNYYPPVLIRYNNGDWFINALVLNSETNHKTRYIENTSKTDVTLLSEDFANIPANDVTFYRINPTGAYMMGSFIKYNSQSGSGVFTTYAGKIFQISNNAGTWSKEELALNSKLDDFLYTPSESYNGDLNSLMTPGWYILGSSATNTPPAVAAGKLKVERGGEVPYIRQTLYCGYDIRIYTRVRYYNNGWTWTSWQEVTNQEVNSKIFNNLSSTTDFNTITTDGIYKFDWVSGGTSYHRPVNQGGQLITCTQGQVKMQIFSTSSSGLFVRGYHDNAWEDWKELSAIKTKEVTGTTGTTQYHGYYYADIDVGVTGYTFISAMLRGTASNLPAFIGYLNGEGKVRVFSQDANTTAYIRVAYI